MASERGELMLWIVQAVKSGWATKEGFCGSINWRSSKFCRGNVGLRMWESTGVEEICPRSSFMKLVCVLPMRNSNWSATMTHTVKLFAKKTFWRRFFFFFKINWISLRKLWDKEQSFLLCENSHFCNNTWSGEERHHIFHLCSFWDCQDCFAAWLLYSWVLFSMLCSNLWGGKKEHFSFPYPSYHLVSSEEIDFLKQSSSLPSLTFRSLSWLM